MQGHDSIASLLEAQDVPGVRVKTIMIEDAVAYEKGGQFYCRDLTRLRTR